MSGLAVGTMIVICGLVWGGLVTLLAFAWHNEKRKDRGA